MTNKDFIKLNLFFIGSCGCDGPPPPPPEKKTDLDIVFLVDGSDSFDASKIGEEWRSGRENSGLKGMDIDQIANYKQRNFSLEEYYKS